MKVNKLRTLRKALSRGLQFALVTTAAIESVPLPDDFGVSQKATVITVLSVIGAVLKAVQNYQKTAGKVPTYPSGYILALAGLAAALTGCVTTTAPDGTTTTTVDSAALETAWNMYERLEARKAALEAERQRADAARQAEIIDELRTLEPQIVEAARRIGLRAE